MISHGSGGLPLLTLAKPGQKQTGGLQTSVSAANIDEKLGKGNRNLLAIKYLLLPSLAGEAGPDSRPASGTIIFASVSPECGSEGERVLPGVPTWVTDSSAGCPTPDATSAKIILGDKCALSVWRT